MNRLTDVVLRFRLLVALMWLAVAVAGGATASTTVDRLTFDFDLPGQAAYETNQQIVEQFGGGGLTEPLLLVVLRRRRRPLVPTGWHGAPRTRCRAPGRSRRVTPAPASWPWPTTPRWWWSTRRRFPARTPYVGARPRLEKVAEAASSEQADGGDVVLSGFTVLEAGGGSDRGLIVEVLIGAIGALVVLALVFGSLLAGLPLLVAAVSILATFLALLGLTYLIDVSSVVEYLVALIGLGVAIDYSLLMVTRWREETAKGATNDEAVRTALATAGRSVVFSGVTVAVSLAALALVPIPFLRSIGFGGLLIPLFSVAISLTLVPALLSAVGPRLNWPRRKPAVTRSRLWATIATGVLRRRWLTVAGSVAVLLALAAPVLMLTLGTAQLDGVASTSPASKALIGVVDDGLPGGVVRPSEVVVPRRRGRAGRSTGSRRWTVSARGRGPSGGGLDRRRPGAPAGLDRRGPDDRRGPGHPDAHPRGRRRRRPPRRRRGRHPGRGRRLHLRGLRQRHLGRAGCGRRDVPAPRPRVALAVAADQGTGAQRALARRGLRRHCAHLAGGRRLRAALQPGRHRRGHDLGADRGVRLPLRALDGLRGVPAVADARGVRRAALPRRRARRSTSGRPPTAPWWRASPVPDGWSPRPR